jgi:hypothetical protein
VVLEQLGVLQSLASPSVGLYELLLATAVCPWQNFAKRLAHPDRAGVTEKEAA